MKSIILSFLFLFTISSVSLAQETLFEWEVPSDGVITYKTVMKRIDTSQVRGIMKNFPQIESADFTTVLTAESDNSIDVEIRQGDIEFSNSESFVPLDTLKMLMNSLGRTQLKGKIDISGSVTSFWLPQTQKNLISLLFELPSAAVEVGDTWSLKNISLVTLNGPYEVTESQQINTVTFQEIANVEGTQVAIFKYEVSESVFGEFGSLKFEFIGTGRFDMKRNKWFDFNGIMKTENSMMGSMTSAQQFSLQ